MCSLLLLPNWIAAKFNNKKHNTMNYEVKEVGIGPNNTSAAVPISAIDDAIREDCWTRFPIVYSVTWIDFKSSKVLTHIRFYINLQLNLLVSHFNLVCFLCLIQGLMRTNSFLLTVINSWKNSFSLKFIAVNCSTGSTAWTLARIS